MNRINIEDWSESIAKYIGKYMESVRQYQYYKLKGEHENYLKYKRQADDEKTNILKTIHSIESYSLLYQWEGKDVLY